MTVVPEWLQELRELYAPRKDMNVLEQCRRAWKAYNELPRFKENRVELKNYLRISESKLYKMRATWSTLEEHRGELLYELLREYFTRSGYEVNMAYQVCVDMDDDQRWEFLYANVPNLPEILEEYE